MMGTYVEVQSKINEKRMVEYENQLKEAEAQALAAQAEQQQIVETTPIVEATT